MCQILKKYFKVKMISSIEKCFKSSCSRNNRTQKSFLKLGLNSTQIKNIHGKDSGTNISKISANQIKPQKRTSLSKTSEQIHPIDSDFQSYNLTRLN